LLALDRDRAPAPIPTRSSTCPKLRPIIVNAPATDQIALLEIAADAARQAGDAILEIYAGDFVAERKADDSPVTAADLEGQRVIIEQLRAQVPEIPILAEESTNEPYELRKSWQRFWLVDPLDGTKEFVKRNGEFTVNIALVEDGVPVLGVVFAPVLERMYGGGPGVGAWRREGDVAEQAIRATGTHGEALVVVASRSHPSPATEHVLNALPEHRLTSMGSSLKLCLVAEGLADIYPRLAPTMEWDTAAAHAVVAAAGGQVLDLEGAPLRYNKSDLKNPHFIVLGRRPVPWRSALPPGAEV